MQMLSPDLTTLWAVLRTVGAGMARFEQWFPNDDGEYRWQLQTADPSDEAVRVLELANGLT